MLGARTPLICQRWGGANASETLVKRLRNSSQSTPAKRFLWFLGFLAIFRKPRLICSAAAWSRSAHQNSPVTQVRFQLLDWTFCSLPSEGWSSWINELAIAKRAECQVAKAS